MSVKAKLLSALSVLQHKVQELLLEVAVSLKDCVASPFYSLLAGYRRQGEDD